MSSELAARFAEIVQTIGKASMEFGPEGNNIISAAFGILTQEVQRENMEAMAAQAAEMNQQGPKMDIGGV